MQKKRILIFSTAYFPLIGGAEIAVKEITDRLPDFEFVMITAKIDPALSTHDRHGSIEYHRLGRGNFFDKYRLILQGPRFAETLGEFDGIWAIMASYAGFAALRYKKRHLNVPYLLTLQEGDSRWDIYKHVWWCWLYFKQIFTKADRIQAISNYLSTWAKDMGATCPIDVVPNGVAVEEFARPHALAEAIRARLGIPATAKVIVSVSRLVKKNGLDILIDAVSQLSSDVHLVIVGSGEEDQSLRVRSQRLGLAVRVHFVGNVSYTDVPAYLQAATVFCRPSRSEGLGNAFIEAMAAGLPVVGTMAGGIPDFLHDDVTGLFCRMNNPGDIAKKIQKILDDPALTEKLRANSLALVKEHYQWDGVAQKMKQIFLSF